MLYNYYFFFNIGKGISEQHHASGRRCSFGCFVITALGIFFSVSKTLKQKLSNYIVFFLIFENLGIFIRF